MENNQTKTPSRVTCRAGALDHLETASNLPNAFLASGWGILPMKRQVKLGLLFTKAHEEEQKASGVCRISDESLKAGGETETEWLVRVIQKASGALSSTPSDWTSGIILPFHKGKGTLGWDWKNYSGITLLSLPCKVFPGVLLSRVKSHLNHLQAHYR